MSLAIPSIAPMTASDSPRCAELEAILFAGDDPWTEAAFNSELAAPHNHYVVARDPGGMVLGYAGVALLGSGDTAESEVHTIGVDPAAQRRGIGSMLLDTLLAVADSHGGPVYLEVRTDNESALALYQREGFETVGLRKRYYQPSGADAFTMRRREPVREAQT